MTYDQWKRNNPADEELGHGHATRSTSCREEMHEECDGCGCGCHEPEREE